MGKKRQTPKRKSPSVVATSLHQRLTLTRVRVQEEMIELYGEEWAAARRREYLERLKDERSGAKQRAAAGGPKPWPDLTPKQREIVASRTREREEEAATVEVWRRSRAQRSGL